MANYLGSKKIYPGNWNEALNGWYKNIDTNDDGTNNADKGGPTSVLAIPGWRYFQFRGYVELSTSGDAAVSAADVIVPSPYQNDSTRPDITGMVVSGDATRPAYVYRAAVSVPSGWDGRVASGIYTKTATHVVSFGRDNSSNPVAESGEPVNTASIASNGDKFIAGGSEGVSESPLLTATGAAGNDINACYKELTATTTFKVYCKATANATSTSSGLHISAADVDAGKKGYVFVEVCYVQPDTAPGYSDLSGYLPNRTVSS